MRTADWVASSRHGHSPTISAPPPRRKVNPGRPPGHSGARDSSPPTTQFASRFEQALQQHASTPDAFEEARTQLAYGDATTASAQPQTGTRAASRRARDIRATGCASLGRPSAGGARGDRRDAPAPKPNTIDELTPQELQIAMLLAVGKTTREAASAMFLSPKTIEYHLRHVYLKLEIHSREELAEALAGQPRTVDPSGT